MAVKFGFKPFGEIMRIRRYIANETLYPGDLVQLVTGPADTTRDTASVAVGTVGAAGILIGAAATYATAGNEILVYDHPDQWFYAATNSADINLGNDLGKNVDFVATAGSTVYKISQQTIDGATTAATIDLPLKLIKKLPIDKGTILGGYATTGNCWVVKINIHQLGEAITGTLGI